MSLMCITFKRCHRPVKGRPERICQKEVLRKPPWFTLERHTNKYLATQTSSHWIPLVFILKYYSMQLSTSVSIVGNLKVSTVKDKAILSYKPCLFQMWYMWICQCMLTWSYGSALEQFIGEVTDGILPKPTKPYSPSIDTKVCVLMLHLHYIHKWNIYWYTLSQTPDMDSGGPSSRYFFDHRATKSVMF